MKNKTPSKSAEKDIYGKHEKHLHEPVKKQLKVPKPKGA
jgi:hypothetical protein